MKRRNFIKLSATASAIGLSPIEIHTALEPLLTLSCPNVSNRKLVLINLSGGNDGLNTVIPLDQYSAYANLRPNIKIPETGGLSYLNLDMSLPSNQQIGLNPALTGLKSLYDAGWLRILQSVGYPSQNRSHFKSGDIYMTGNDGNFNLNGTNSGWIGRFMELYYPSEITEPYPLAIQIGSDKTSLGFHGVEEHGLSLNLTGQDPAGFYSILNGLGGQAPNTFPNSDYGTELAFIAGVDALSNTHAASISDAFNSGTNTSTYPDTDLADQLKTVAKLISGNLKTKVYMVRISGFDTHNNQIQGLDDPLGKHYNLLNELSEAITAFVNDLNQQGIGEDVSGLTYSEFGRKAGENGNMGTDHGQISPAFVFGEAIEGGVSGLNVDLSEATSDNNFQLSAVQYDYRQTVATLLQDFLGAQNSVIDSTFFNYSSLPSATSFTTSKIDELIKPLSKVSEGCLNKTLAVNEFDTTPKELKKWQVYPNPFRDIITIFGLEEVYEIEYKIINNIGSTILYDKMIVNGSSVKINLSNLITGMYFIQIKKGFYRELHKILKI